MYIHLQLYSDEYKQGSIHQLADGKFYWFNSNQWPEAGYLSGGWIGPYESKVEAEKEAELY